MKDADKKFWPFQRRVILISTAGALLVLVLLVAGLRRVLDWPGPQSETVVLIGVLLLSLLPILLALLDVVVERGGTIGYGDFKLDFSQARGIGIAGITVPANIGVRGKSVSDRETTQILDSLKQAATNEVVVIDLEDGTAWWETRLFVLLAGADRLKKPEKLVFVGKDAGMEQRFQGWSYASDLLPLLVKAHPRYERSLQAARAAARQWELVEPLEPDAQGNVSVPTRPAWVSGTFATRHDDWAFDTPTRLRNELLAEQLLQDDLGQILESKGPRNITLVRLEELFRPVLYKECIDVAWAGQRQLDSILDTEAPSMAITENGRYSTLAARVTLLNEVLKTHVRGRTS